MKQTPARIATALVAFILGTTTSLLWPRYRIPQSSPPNNAAAQSAQTALSTTSIVTPPPVNSLDSPFIFSVGLILISNEVQLKNELLRYRVNVIYPQIAGSDKVSIRKLNKQIERLATENYQWLLHPSREDLRYYTEDHPEAFNWAFLDYEVVLATDSFLSLYFYAESYGIGAANGVQYSFVVNYDIASHREIKLSDIFRPDSKYLKFISEYCIDQLSRGEYGQSLRKDELAPVSKNFESWNLTRDGIRFNFDECKVFGCSGGKQTVEIPFTDLRPIMSIR